MMLIEVNEITLKAIEKSLDKLSGKAPSVMKKAVNDTAKKARKQLADQAKKRYAMKIGSFNKAMTIRNATVGNLIATIQAKGKVNELMDFRASPKTISKGTKGEAATRGKVLVAGKLKQLQVGDRKAFVVRFRNGHVSVVQRVENGNAPKGSHLGNRYMKVLFSPSIVKMIGNEQHVYGLVEPKIADELRENVQKRIEELMRN